MPTKARGLGRGLEALLPQRRLSPAELSSILSIPVEKLSPGKGQPRKSFDPQKMEELAQSIREHGIIEPLIVARVGEDAYSILAGERRWRAAQKAGLLEVPCLLRDASPADQREIALIENVQREDLNPIDLAEAIQELMEEFGYSQEKVGEKIGFSQSRVSELVLLLKLPRELRAAIRKGRVTARQGNILLKVKDKEKFEELSKKVLRGIKEPELARLISGGSAPEEPSKETAESNPNIRDLQLRIERKAGAKVKLTSYGKNGLEIVIRCYSLEDADLVVNRIFS